MSSNRFPCLRFRLASLFILTLGIAIGFSLSLLPIPSFLRQAHTATLPRYVIEPPDILLIDVSSDSVDQPNPITGQHLVGPDGRVNLGQYGTLFVSGMTLEGVREAVEQQVSQKIASPQVFVDILAYNSKVYYVIVKGRAGGDNAHRMSVTGNETVLDAIAQIGGLKVKGSAKLWIARPAPNGVGGDMILPIDWNAISNGRDSSTNYQLRPGDRLYIDDTGSSSAGE